MVAVNISTDNYVNPDEVITEQMLGAEHLGGENFVHVINNLTATGVSHLRWPGGIPAEDIRDSNGDYIYDLTNPEVMDWTRNGGEAASLTDVLQAVSANDMTFSMVAPTARYVQDMHESGANAPAPDAYDDMYGFLERFYQIDPETGTNAFGLTGAEIPQLTMEIGSEYYSTQYWQEAIDTHNMDVSDLAFDYGQVFAELARAIGDFEAANGVEINTAVQAARFQSSGVGDSAASQASAADNQSFILAMEDADALDAVDSVIWHRYTDGFDQIDHGIEGDIYGTNLETMMSEWEVATQNPDLDLVLGWLTPDVRSAGELLAQGDLDLWGAESLSSILQGFSTLAGAGMDYGTIYSLGSNSNYGSLSLRDEVFIGGDLYDLMAESLPGLYLHDGYQENTSSLEATHDDFMNEYHFSNEYKIVSFYAAKDMDLEKGDVFHHYAEYSDNVVDVSGVRLFDPNGINEISSEQGTPIGVDGVIENMSPFLRADHNGAWFQFNHDFEVVRLEMYRENVEIGESFSMDEHSQQIQTLTLTGGSDINGTGNSIDNVLNGNSGGNVLNGLDGNDVLAGGAGDDTLSGGAGQDQMNGGEGADIYAFEQGDMVDWDRLRGSIEDRNAQLDVIEDFEIGKDKVLLSGLDGVTDMSDLKIWQNTINGDVHYTVQNLQTNERFLINTDDDVTWDDITNADNFVIDAVDETMSGIVPL